MTVVNSNEICRKCDEEIGDDPNPVTATCDVDDCTHGHVWHEDCVPDVVRFTMEMNNGD